MCDGIGAIDDDQSVVMMCPRCKGLPAGRIAAERGYGLADLAHVHVLDEGEYLCPRCQKPRSADKPDGCEDWRCP